jgi:hypothetical protein
MRLIGGVRDDRHFVGIRVPHLEYFQTGVISILVAFPVLALNFVAETACLFASATADGLGILVLLAVGHCAVTILIK